MQRNILLGHAFRSGPYSEQDDVRRRGGRKKSAVSRTALKSTKGGGFGGNVGLASNVRALCAGAGLTASTFCCHAKNGIPNRETLRGGEKCRYVLRTRQAGSSNSVNHRAVPEQRLRYFSLHCAAHPQRTTSTGIVAWLSTFRVSLPRSMDMMLRRPCEVITMRSQPRCSAVLTISSYG